MRRVGLRLCLLLDRIFPKQIPSDRNSPFGYIEASIANTRKFVYEKAFKNLKFLSFEEKNVLDLGCGMGGGTFFYVTSFNVKSITGVDIDGKSLKYARDYLKEELPSYEGKVSFIRANGERLPFKDNTFDIIISDDVIEHLSNPSKVIAELRRVLKPGGFLVISFPPYYHPFGHHLYDYINIPWAHLIFSEDILIEAVRRTAQRVGTSGRFPPEYVIEIFRGLNNMSVRKFRKVVEQNFSIVYWKLGVPEKKRFLLLCLASYLPFIGELFIGRVLRSTEEVNYLYSEVFHLKCWNPFDVERSREE